MLRFPTDDTQRPKWLKGIKMQEINVGEKQLHFQLIVPILATPTS